MFKKYAPQTPEETCQTGNGARAYRGERVVNIYLNVYVHTVLYFIFFTFCFCTYGDGIPEVEFAPDRNRNCSRYYLLADRFDLQRPRLERTLPPRRRTREIGRDTGRLALRFGTGAKFKKLSVTRIASRSIIRRKPGELRPVSMDIFFQTMTRICCANRIRLLGYLIGYFEYHHE